MPVGTLPQLEIFRRKPVLREASASFFFAPGFCLRPCAATVEREFSAQPEPLRIRFESIVRGLVLAASGERLTRALRNATGAQPLLGWSAGRHPQLR